MWKSNCKMQFLQSNISLKRFKRSFKKLLKKNIGENGVSNKLIW
jgi:hypothetical protein